MVMVIMAVTTAMAAVVDCDTLRYSNTYIIYNTVKTGPTPPPRPHLLRLLRAQLSTVVVRLGQ